MVRLHYACYPLRAGLGGPHSRSGRFGKQKFSPAHFRIKGTSLYFGIHQNRSIEADKLLSTFFFLLAVRMVTGLKR